MQFSMMTAHATLDAIAARPQQIVHGVGAARQSRFGGLHDQYAAFAWVRPATQECAQGVDVAGLGNQKQVAILGGTGAASHIANLLIAVAT